MALTAHMTRRSALATLLAGVALPRTVLGDITGTAFSYEWLKDQMQARAQTPDAPPPPLDNFLQNLTYDDYRNIYFRPEAARWSDTPLPFHVSSFHPGWLFKEPVKIHEVTDGAARPLTFSTDDFEYRNDVGTRVPDHAELAGIAGLKLTHPLNTPDKFDEVVTFLGASYFRALGRGNSYGLSARGLAINTWLNGPEEFPRFSEFWLERPKATDASLTVYAALDSASVTGAYKFTITPGDDTTMDVEATLFFRETVPQLGLGPLTSMFYFAEHTERDFDDFRRQVHDSEALKIIRKNGNVILRPLNNPPRVSSSYFDEPQMAQFGLVQRDRTYEDYQDAGARYHDRPSVMIEPLNDWGPGIVRLVEIPADLEIDDNIVAFWVPKSAPQVGESRTYSYRMHWGDLPQSGDLAWVQGTLAGIGGPSGVPLENPNLRKFVIDFEGGALGTMPEDAKVTPIVTHSAGDIEGMVLHKVSDAAVPTWRLFIDIDGQDHDLIELTAHVADDTQRLSETWVFQWLRDDVPS
ncbi:glucans biosynthesis protein G [Tateyamaria omphalii]|uniref:glucan biosynthesis protein n=1 Tax=Tateyamaria omphalii TaxID=299262 RepID=UPI00199DD877|nr:glucan biosynthesis protein G [Tateyamaria omphalii]GGX69277.1 glucans biosynthesis protein G [Tateyamaria omphalii]